MTACEVPEAPDKVHLSEHLLKSSHLKPALHHDASAKTVSTIDDVAAAPKKRPPLLVIKVGTSTMMQTKSLHFCMSNLGKFVDAVCSMKEAGYQVVLVCSGAVGAGCIHLKLSERPANLEGKQAASAVGQCRMMRLYEDLFAIREQKVAQLIITRPDLMDHTRFLNFKNMLKELLRLDVLPIVNENDSIATSHLRFGDNDTLSAYVAVTLGAQWLFLLTDVDCLYTKNPRFHPDALPIPYVGHLDDVYALLDDTENAGTAWGTGGMRTKIIAAKIATATGIHTALCHGEYPDRVLDIIRFAESHAQTPEMWETFLRNLAAAAYERKMSGNFSMKTSISVATTNTGASASDFGGMPRFGCGVDVSGLAHYHTGKYKRISSSPSLQSNENDPSPQNSTAAAAAVPEIMSTLQAELGNAWGLVTAPSLKAMPYLGTIFGAQECTQDIHDQRRWILSLPVRGRIYVDDDTARKIVEDHAHLKADGITYVEGTFFYNEATIICRDQCAFPRQTGFASHQASQESKSSHHSSRKSRHAAHRDDAPSLDQEPSVLGNDDESELARCLVNFASEELDQIKGLDPSMFSKVLGYVCDPIVADRENIIFMNPCSIYGCRHCGKHH